MEDDDKTKILAFSEQQKKTSNPTQSKFSIILHDVTLTQDVPPNKLEDVLIGMVTKHSNRADPNSHPGDIRSVLSQPAKTAKVT